MTHSALYEGFVAHRRLAAPEHSFRYRTWMALLDLDELPEVLDRHPLWSARRPAPVRFRAADLFEDLEAPGPVRVLAAPRVLGVGFNPVKFAYLHDAGGELESVIAEVTNTPWGDRHRYAAIREPGSGQVRATFRKRLHVSPFQSLGQHYELEASEPRETLRVSIYSHEGDRRVFEAVLALRRIELSRREMTRVLVRHPPVAAATLARIYRQAARLRLRRAPRFSRPSAPRRARRRAPAETASDRRRRVAIRSGR